MALVQANRQLQETSSLAFADMSAILRAYQPNLFSVVAIRFKY
jgi:hypothetical protein